MTKKQLIDELVKEGHLKTPLLVEAFKTVDRADFVPAELAREAYWNYPLPIGYDQTISQPLTVAFMLELLNVRAGDKVLDVGAGSGWQTALLAYLVGKEGTVVAIERIPELKEMAESNIGKYKELNTRVKIILGDGSKGMPKEAPFGRIIAGAAAGNIPEAWLRQLRIGGVLVAPVEDSVFRITRNSREDFEREEFWGFSFVPLIRD